MHLIFNLVFIVLFIFTFIESNDSMNSSEFAVLPEFENDVIRKSHLINENLLKNFNKTEILIHKRRRRDNSTPRILSEGREIKVVNGSDLELACDVENLGKSIILWKLNRTILLFAGDQRIQINDRFNRGKTKGSLLIQSIQLENAGEYSCSISINQRQDIVYTIQVIALSPPQIRPQPLNGQADVKKNDPIKLKCDVDNVMLDFPINITWRKMNDESFNARHHSGSELLIPKARKNDTGIYECLATNKIGETSANFSVKVLFAPEVEVEKNYVYAPIGQSVEITCKVDGEPSPNVVWSYNNFNLTENDKYVFRRNDKNEKLKIMNVSREDYGNYLCLANNNLGSNLKIIEVTEKRINPQFTTTQLSDEKIRTEKPTIDTPNSSSSSFFTSLLILELIIVLALML